MSTQIRGGNFVLLPPELKRPYAFAKGLCQPRIDRLRELDAKEMQSSAERMEAEQLLQSMYETCEEQMLKVYKRFNNVSEAIKAEAAESMDDFEKEFGHAPPLVAGREALPNCISMAVILTQVLSGLGENKVGVLIGHSHTSAVVKVCGKTYAMDQITRGIRKPIELKDYLKTVRKAYWNEEHPLHVPARLNHPMPPEQFEHYLMDAKYYGGTKPALAVAYLHLGLASFIARRYKLAERNLSTAASLLPDHASAHHMLAVIKLDGDFADGLKHARKAVQTNPNEPTIQRTWAEYLRRQGKYEEAHAALQKASRLEDGYETRGRKNH